MIKEQTGRKLLFNQSGHSKAPITERYQKQVVAISEKSDEQVNMTMQSFDANS